MKYIVAIFVGVVIAILLAVALHAAGLNGKGFALPILAVGATAGLYVYRKGAP